MAAISIEAYKKDIKERRASAFQQPYCLTFPSVIRSRDKDLNESCCICHRNRL